MSRLLEEPYDLVGRAPERRTYVVVEEPYNFTAAKIAETLRSIGWHRAADRVADMEKTAASANLRERELLTLVQRLQNRIHELSPPPPEHCPKPSPEASD